jgi:hypothetical protein
MKTTFNFTTQPGKRTYSLWIDIEDYLNRFRIEGNRILIRGKKAKLNKNSHKDYGNAFTVDYSNEYYTIIEFKKGIKSLQIATIEKWTDNRHLIRFEEGSSI